MAIKIIKEGRKKIPIYGARCSFCECEFEFNKEDFTELYERVDRFGLIQCPHCGNDVTFKTNPKRYLIIVKD